MLSRRENLEDNLPTVTLSLVLEVGTQGALGHLMIQVTMTAGTDSKKKPKLLGKVVAHVITGQLNGRVPSRRYSR